MFYKNMISKFGTTIIRVESSVEWSIPEDPKNTDYQTYLKWLAEGNEPEIINMDEV